MKLEEILEPTSDCCIYRIPQFLRKENEEAYSPKLVSIGPLHYNKSDLISMEKYKRSYLSKFLNRVDQAKWNDFKFYVELEEHKIRSCYAVSSMLNSVEYVEMVLHDAIFIIEILIRNKNEHETHDFLLDKSQYRTHLTIDFLLLENQLPYFILETLYSKAFPDQNDENPPFLVLCLNYFKPFLKNIELIKNRKVLHFTDLLRYSFLSEKIHNYVLTDRKEPNEVVKTSIIPKVTEESEEISDLPSATKLAESGVTFKKTEKNKPLLEIKLTTWKKWCSPFQETLIEIPSIEIYDELEVMFRNVMALEILHYPWETYVCHYADLMNYLIDVADDVELLAKEGIIANCIGDYERIAHMFNNLTNSITASSYHCCYHISKAMIEHYNNKWNRNKTTLKRVYFPTVIIGTATVVASIVVVLDIIQTICSILQVKQGGESPSPPKSL